MKAVVLTTVRAMFRIINEGENTSSEAKSQLLKALGYKVLADIVSGWQR